jgi:hypothetical protein
MSRPVKRLHLVSKTLNDELVETRWRGERNDGSQ